MRDPRLILIGAPLLFVCLVGCESAPVAGVGPARITPVMSDSAGRAMVRTEMLFGLSRADGTGIGELDWEKFVDDSIAAWFPGGFTVIDATGRWRGPDGKITAERSKVLVIFNDGSETTLRKLEEIRRLYRGRFDQDSVIRASTNAWVAF